MIAKSIRRTLLLLAILIESGGNVVSKDITILVPQSTSSIPFFELEKADAGSDVVPGATVTVEVFANHAQALAGLLDADVELL